MAAALSAASLNSLLQSKVTMPRSSAAKADVAFNRSTRYVMFDRNQTQRETTDVEGSRTMDSRSKRSCRLQVIGPVDRDITCHQDMAVRSSLGCENAWDRRKRWQRRGCDDKVAQSSFQIQVLHELRKLNESQRLEVETLERVQRERDTAERKAHRLEQQLQAQQHQMSQSKGQTGHEPCNKSTFLTPDSGTLGPRTTRSPKHLLVEKEVEPREWDERATSPPPYDSAASPATLLYKRSSGWPAWTKDDWQSLRSSSEPPATHSATDRQPARRSCAFLDDKARAHAESAQLATEAAQRLERARHAVPPRRLLERQARAQAQKLQDLHDRARELASRSKQAKARQVPDTTYVVGPESEEETMRKERIGRRTKNVRRFAEIPGRGRTSGTRDQGATDCHRPIWLRNQLQIASEAKAHYQHTRPYPVPDFDKLHFAWKTRCNAQKDAERPVQTSAEFFTSRVATLVALHDKKEARKVRRQAKEAATEQRVQRAQGQLLARTCALHVARRNKSTKTELLRAQKVLADATKHANERQGHERDAVAREKRHKQATRRVWAQVKRLEAARRHAFAGTLVDGKDVDRIAMQKAQEQRQQFKEALTRNRAKLVAATATCPSLMERFSANVRRKTSRSAALETVVKRVFQKDLSTLKGVLTDDEHKIACAIVAADTVEEE